MGKVFLYLSLAAVCAMAEPAAAASPFKNVPLPKVALQLEQPGTSVAPAPSKNQVSGQIAASGMKPPQKSPALAYVPGDGPRTISAPPSSPSQSRAFRSGGSSISSGVPRRWKVSNYTYEALMAMPDDEFASLSGHFEEQVKTDFSLRNVHEYYAIKTLGRQRSDGKVLKEVSSEIAGLKNTGERVTAVDKRLSDLESTVAELAKKVSAAAPFAQPQSPKEKEQAPADRAPGVRESLSKTPGYGPEAGGNVSAGDNSKADDVSKIRNLAADRTIVSGKGAKGGPTPEWTRTVMKSGRKYNLDGFGVVWMVNTQTSLLIRVEGKYAKAFESKYGAAILNGFADHGFNFYEIDNSLLNRVETKTQGGK